MTNFAVINNEKETYATRADPQKESALIDAIQLNYSFFKSIGLFVKSELFWNLVLYQGIFFSSGEKQ